VTVSIAAVPGPALTLIKEDLARLELEPDFCDSVRHHYEHLEALSASLRTLGIESQTIDRHVLEIFDKYKTELLRNIGMLTPA
jgi:hypothetical protein